MTRRLRQVIRTFDRYTLGVLNPAPADIIARPRRLA